MFVGFKKKKKTLPAFFVKPGGQAVHDRAFAFLSFSLHLLFLHSHCEKGHLETHSGFGMVTAWRCL